MYPTRRKQIILSISLLFLEEAFPLPDILPLPPHTHIQISAQHIHTGTWLKLYASHWQAEVEHLCGYLMWDFTSSSSRAVTRGSPARFCRIFSLGPQCL